jgi:hypothetical protein
VLHEHGVLLSYTKQDGVCTTPPPLFRVSINKCIGASL